MKEQMNLFSAKTTVIKKRPWPKPTGPVLRDEGIKKAADNAEAKEPGWHEQALECVRNYPVARFMAEDVRAWAYEQGLPVPPSNRAWGSVITKAKKEGIIKFSGYANVSNPKAHSTPASVWVKEEL